MNDYLDFLDTAPADSNNPLAVLRAAQEKLRKEEEAKKAFEALLAQKADPTRYDEVEQQIANPPANAALDKIISRVEKTGPLDDAAKITPQELERQMYERVWGAPAKSKIGKVGKGISNFLGAFSGLPQDFSKPAMEQFLKIQQQHRMAQTADMNALSSAANTTQRQTAGQQKSVLDLKKLMNMNEGQIMKYVMDRYRNDNTAKFNAGTLKHYENLDANSKEMIRLRGEEMLNKLATNPFGFSKMLDGMPPEKQKEMLTLYDIVTTLQGANKGSGGGGSSTLKTTRETLTENEFGNPVKGPSVTTTSTRQGAGGNAMLQQRADSYRKQLADRIGMPAPMGPAQMPPPQGGGNMPVPGARPTAPLPKTDEPDSVMSSEAVRGEDTFRLSNPAFSNTFKRGEAATQFKGLKEQTQSAYELSSRLLRGIEQNYIKDVMGAKNQKWETVGRFLEGIKIPGGKEIASGIQNTVNDITGKYEGEWDKQKLYEDVTRERVNIISQKVLEMSGKAASDKERAFLSAPYIHLSDSPIAATHKILRLTTRLGVLTRMRELGIGDANNMPPDVLAKINEYLDDQADALLNRSRDRSRNKMADAKTGKFDVSELNPDRLLYGALKKGGLLERYPQLRLEQVTPKKATKKLEQKLKGLNIEKGLKSLGFLE